MSVDSSQRVSGVYARVDASQTTISATNENEETDSNYSNIHRRHMSWTGLGSDFKDQPVCRSSYSSLPQTSAVMFLASLAENDSIVSGPTEIYDGAEVGGYVMGRIIGRGAYSECREGFKKAEPSQKLALKIVKNEGLHSTIQHETEVWSGLRHRGFLPLLDVVSLHDITIVVSPYAERGSLLKHLQNCGPFESEQAKVVFRELCEALNYLHTEKRILHHDIKLENILLDKSMKPYLCDFGLSEYIDEFNEWCLGTNPSEEDLFMKGSLWYLPPEIMDCTKAARYSAKDFAPLDSGTDWSMEKTKVDVWAMGIVLYAMITGGLPFTDDFLPRLQQTICRGDYPPLDDGTDEDLADLLATLLTVDRDSRPLMKQIIKHPWLKK